MEKRKTSERFFRALHQGSALPLRKVWLIALKVYIRAEICEVSPVSIHYPHRLAQRRKKKVCTLQHVKCGFSVYLQQHTRFRTDLICKDVSVWPFLQCFGAPGCLNGALESLLRLSGTHLTQNLGTPCCCCSDNVHLFSFFRFRFISV